MKLALLNDLPVAGSLTSGWGSGAELSSGAFIREGHLRGHVVDVLAPDFTTPDLLREYDLLVTKNVVNFRQEILDAVKRQKFVAWPSDYAWTRWRLYFAFQESHRRFPKLKLWEDFFTKSLFNVFLSPLHRDAYEWVMPAVGRHEHVLSPPPVNTALFKPAATGHIPATAATVNGGLDFKGLKATLSWVYEHPEVHFAFLGNIRENVEMPPNARHIGPVPQSKLAEALGSVETYVELPMTAQPYNKTAVEGLLACGRVVTNDNMGAASYDWFRRGDREEARRAVEQAIPDLWSSIEKVAT